MDEPGDALAWTVRSFVYRHIVERERPPTVDEAASALSIEAGQARSAYRRLHERHALFLEPGTDAVRMAHPFSGAPTPFRVRTDEHSYWANCAWDALGIPAALHADAIILATYAEDGAPAQLVVEAGRVPDHGEVIHFLLPFRAWYDDLIFT